MYKPFFLFILFILLVFTPLLYAQSSGSLTSKTELDRIIASFEQSIDSVKLKRKGLLFKGISGCETPVDYNKTKKSMYGYHKPSDTVVSIKESDTSLTVKLIIYKTSYNIHLWSTALFINDDVLNIRCFAIAQAMGHLETFSPICLTINFEKLNDNTFEGVMFNEKLYRKE